MLSKRLREKRDTLVARLYHEAGKLSPAEIGDLMGFSRKQVSMFLNAKYRNALARETYQKRRRRALENRAEEPPTIGFSAPFFGVAFEDAKIPEGERYGKMPPRSETRMAGAGSTLSEAYKSPPPRSRPRGSR